MTKTKFVIPNERQFVIYPMLYILYIVILAAALIYSLGLSEPSETYVTAYFSAVLQLIALYRYMNGLYQNIVAQKILDGVKVRNSKLRKLCNKNTKSYP